MAIIYLTLTGPTEKFQIAVLIRLIFVVALPLESVMISIYEVNIFLVDYFLKFCL